MLKFKEFNLAKKDKWNKEILKVRDIPKLDDANFALYKKSIHMHQNIFKEGDSAKSMAIAGLSVVGKQICVFPLKGKMLNVREHL